MQNVNVLYFFDVKIIAILHNLCKIVQLGKGETSAIANKNVVTQLILVYLLMLTRKHIYNEMLENVKNYEANAAKMQSEFLDWVGSKEGEEN